MMGARVLLVCAAGACVSTSMRPPRAMPPLAIAVAEVRTDLTADEVRGRCARAERDLEMALDRVVAVPEGQRSFATVIVPLEAATSDYDEATQQLSFLENVHLDADVRAAGVECEALAGRVKARVEGRADLYRAVRSAVDREGGQLDPQEQHLVDNLLRDYRQVGADLDDARRERIAALRGRVAEIGAAFSANLTKTTSFEVSREELLAAGLSESFIAGLGKAASGKLLVPSELPVFWNIVNNCKSESLRHRMWLLFWQRGGAENIAMMQELLKLRDEMRTILGAKSWAAVVARDNMTGSVEVVTAFLARLRAALAPRIRVEGEVLRQLAAAETGHEVKRVNAWDGFYYQEQWRRRDLDLDEEALRRHFPVDRVLAGAFEVYQRVLGVKIEEVAGAKAWAPGVKLYAMRDVTSHELLARFYIDLYPRPGKWNHAGAFALTRAQQTPAGRRPALSALVVNFAPGGGLTFAETRLLFHELGHVMHSSVGAPRYRSLNRLPNDFNEAPAELFELWPYEPEVLKLISVGDAPIDRLAASRSFAKALYWGGQLAYSLSDQEMHGRPGVDADTLMRDNFAEVLGYAEDPQEHFAASFEHVLAYKDASYYAYLWSAVYAADLNSRFRKEGLFSPRADRDLRRFLASGEDPKVTVRAFLGREPSEDAFLEQIGAR